MTTINVKDASGATVALEKPLIPGQTTMANSRPVVIAVDQTAFPVTVSGTVTVTGSINALQAGAWGVRNQDGSGNAITSAARGAERAWSVQIVDAGGNQITNFGSTGGTSSTVNAAAPSLATAAGFFDGTNMQLARVFDADTGLGTQFVAGLVERVPGSGGSIGKTFGPGASDSGTQRIVVSSDQLSSLGQTTMSASAPVAIASDQSGVRTVSGGFEYETVAASQTNQVMGGTGAIGDYIEGLICVVAAAATSQVQIKDGSGTAITVLPNNVGAGVGTYFVPLGLNSVSGAWQVSTAAGVSVIGTGNFT